MCNPVKVSTCSNSWSCFCFASACVAEQARFPLRAINKVGVVVDSVELRDLRTADAEAVGDLQQSRLALAAAEQRLQELTQSSADLTTMLKNKLQDLNEEKRHLEKKVNMSNGSFLKADSINIIYIASDNIAIFLTLSSFINCNFNSTSICTLVLILKLNVK